MSTIIRATADTHMGTQSPRSVAFNFEDMADRAENYLGQVRAEAAKIVQQARQQAELIRRDAEQEGRRAAWAEVERLTDEKAGHQMESVLPALRQAVAQLELARQDWSSHWQHIAVHVATAIAARVIRREVRQSPEISLALVRESLEMAAGSAELTLYLSPQDLAHLGSRVRQIATELLPLASARVVADDKMTCGGCRLETRFGTIDQQIESQLQRIEEELT